MKGPAESPQNSWFRVVATMVYRKLVIDLQLCHSGGTWPANAKRRDASLRWPPGGEHYAFARPLWSTTSNRGRKRVQRFATDGINESKDTEQSSLLQVSCTILQATSKSFCERARLVGGSVARMSDNSTSKAVGAMRLCRGGRCEPCHALEPHKEFS
jgi:hypothetical protein